MSASNINPTPVHQLTPRADMHALLKPWAEIESIHQQVLYNFDLPIDLRIAYSRHLAGLMKTDFADFVGNK